MCHRGTCLTESVLHHVAGKFSLVRPGYIAGHKCVLASDIKTDSLRVRFQRCIGLLVTLARTRACRRVPGASVVA